MRMSGLSLDSMPPLFIPLRFFLTAPWFGGLAALLLLLNSDDILASRWSNEMLAFTHLLTLGFMMMIMTGALFQFIPVITGHSIPGTKKITPIIHIGLIVGTFLLVTAFLVKTAIFFQLAVIFLFLAVGLFAIALTRLLLTNIIGREAIFVLRLVNIALFITLGLGLYMAIAYAFPDLAIPFRRYTDIHLMWGLLGWTILLIMAVSSQVIPMFYVTPSFPALYLRGLSTGIIVILMLLSWFYLSQSQTHTQTQGNAELLWWGELLFSLEILFFCFYTFFMLNQRKRKVKDITINFWRLALMMPVIAVLVYWSNDSLWHIAAERLEILLGMLLIFGFTISSIIGMLQKIVSFIVYLHLQRLSMSHPMGMGLLPNMQTLISVKSQEVQFYLHLSTILLLAISIFYNAWTPLAALMMLLDFMWLAYNLTRCAKTYLELEKKIKAA